MCPFSIQRAAVWCKAVWKATEIPPGAASLKASVGQDGFARYSESVIERCESFVVRQEKTEVVPRNLRPLSVWTGDFIFWRNEYETL